MSTWVELRCSVTEDDFDEPRTRRCYSDDNIGPMDMASDTRHSLVKLMQNLEEQARDQGWRKTTKGWVCPACLSQGYRSMAARS